MLISFFYVNYAMVSFDNVNVPWTAAEFTIV